MKKITLIQQEFEKLSNFKGEDCYIATAISFSQQAQTATIAFEDSRDYIISYARDYVHMNKFNVYYKSNRQLVGNQDSFEIVQHDYEVV